MLTTEDFEFQRQQMHKSLDQYFDGAITKMEHLYHLIAIMADHERDEWRKNGGTQTNPATA